MRRNLCFVILLCLFLLVACNPAPTTFALPTDAPRETMAPPESITGNAALDTVIDENKPEGCYEFDAKYTAKSEDTGAFLGISYTVRDFWLLLDMLKVSHISYIKAAPAVFDADPDLERVVITYQIPTDPEKQEIGPQPILIIEVSRDKVAQVIPYLAWCKVKNVVDKYEMSAEATDVWKDYCP